MENFDHVMIDLETMGISFNAPIIQIGAVYFDIDTGDTSDILSINVNLQSSINIGTEMDASTVQWWMSQPVDARTAVLKGPKEDIHTAMSELNEFAGKCSNLWCHTSFDTVVIANHFSKLNMHNNMNYRNYRDIRTLVNLSGIDISSEVQGDEGIKHTAVDDCKYQIKYCCAAYRALTQRKQA